MVLPKTMRLKGHRCFDHLYRDGTRYHEPSILLRVVKAENKLYKFTKQRIDSKACRCAIAISSKVSKKAVVRNRLRRIIHQHLRARLSQASEHSNKWALFSLKPQASSREPLLLLEECDRLLLKSGLLQ